MKITLPLSKSDEKTFQACHKKMTEFLGSLVQQKKKIPEPLVTAPEVTQNTDDMEKGDKVGSSLEGSQKTSVCVTPHPSLKTPPP